MVGNCSDEPPVYQRARRPATPPRHPIAAAGQRRLNQADQGFGDAEVAFFPPLSPTRATSRTRSCHRCEKPPFS